MAGLTELEEAALDTLRVWSRRAMNGRRQSSRKIGQERLNRLREVCGDTETFWAMRLAANGQVPQDDIARLRPILRTCITIMDGQEPVVTSGRGEADRLAAMIRSEFGTEAVEAIADVPIDFDGDVDLVMVGFPTPRPRRRRKPPDRG